MCCIKVVDKINMVSIIGGKTHIKQINIQINTYLQILIGVIKKKQRVFYGVLQED